MARRSRRRNSNGNGNGVNAQRAPMNLRLLTTRYGPSTRPLNLNASSRHPRRENWDDWVAVEDRGDVGTLTSVLKAWFPSLDPEFSDSEWEDIESPRSSKRASLEASAHPDSPTKGKGKGKARARVEEDDAERRPSTSSLQSVLEEDEGETSGGDADISADGSSRLASRSTLDVTSRSSSTASSVRRTPRQPARQMPSLAHSPSDLHLGERSPGASHATPRSYPTMSFSTGGTVSERAERPSFAMQRSPGASYMTPRSAIPSFSTECTTERPSLGSLRSERTERTERRRPERPCFATPLSLSPSHSPRIERQKSFGTELSIEFTPVARPLTLSPPFMSSLGTSSHTDYEERPSFSTQRSFRSVTSCSTQRTSASVAAASMGLALRLQQVSAVPTLTALPSHPALRPERPTTPSTLSSPTSPPITPPRATPTPLSRAHTPYTPGTPNSSNQGTAGGASGTSTYRSTFGYANDTTASSPSALLPSLPSHLVLSSSSRSLASFATFGKRTSSLPSKTLLHDLDAQSLSYSRSIFSLPSVPSMAGVAPFLNDLDVISFGDDTFDITHEGTIDSHDDTLPTINVSEHGHGWPEGVTLQGGDGETTFGVLNDTPTTAAASRLTPPASGRTPRTNAEEYASPVVPRLATRPLNSSGETADGRGRVARTLRSIQSLGALRPAASLQSLRAKFVRRPSDGAPRPRLKSKGKGRKRPALPSNFADPPSTPSRYRGGVPGSPAPPSALQPRSRGRVASTLPSKPGKSPMTPKTPKTPKTPRSKTQGSRGKSGKPPVKPSPRLRIRRPKSHLLRHEAASNEAEENERRLRDHLETHGHQRRESRLKALRLRGLL